MIFTDLGGNEHVGGSLPHDDPAWSSVAIRRTHFLRDNGDGTVTFGIEREDGSFLERTYSGTFPTGEVVVVFKDHSYTPNKTEIAPSVDPMTYTFHWDSITVAFDG